MVKASALNFLDRSLGFLFGIIRGAVIVCILYLGLSWIMPPAEQPDWVRSARAMPLIENGADMLRALIPEDATEIGAEAAGNIQNKIEKKLEPNRIFRDMLTKEPEAPKTNGGDSGYNRGERQEMERLIEGNRQ